MPGLKSRRTSSRSTMLPSPLIWVKEGQWAVRPVPQSPEADAVWRSSQKRPRRRRSWQTRTARAQLLTCSLTFPPPSGLSKPLVFTQLSSHFQYFPTFHHCCAAQNVNFSPSNFMLISEMSQQPHARTSLENFGFWAPRLERRPDAWRIFTQNLQDSLSMGPAAPPAEPTNYQLPDCLSLWPTVLTCPLRRKLKPWVVVRSSVKHNFLELRM